MQAVQDYYRSILMNDLLYPHRIEHLYDYMRSRAEQNTIFLIYCKCSISQSERTDDPSKRPIDDTPLPSLITEKVEDIGKKLRKGKVRQRFTTFARRFLNEVGSGENGQKNIHWQHINAMMDKPDLKNRQTQDRYKKLLHQTWVDPRWLATVHPPRECFQQVSSDQVGLPGVRELPREGGGGRIGLWIYIIAI